MSYMMRTTKPSTGNKYFIRKANGGWSDAITGSPTDSQCNVLANCVGYAYGRFNEIGGYGYCKYLRPVNAENFIQYAGGLTVGSIPKVGACMVWQKGATLSGSDGAGHVAIVERVDSNNQVFTSESGYGGSAFWTQIRTNSNGRWGAGSDYKFLGFIYNPAVSDNPKPTPTPTEDYTLVVTVKGYTTAANAAARTNSNSTVPEGTYKVFSKSSSMINITRAAGSPGWWINPEDNVKPASQPMDPFPGVSDEELARRVWAGEFGNGEAREKALGIRYKAVQELVDKGVGKPEPTPPAPKPETISIGDKVVFKSKDNWGIYTSYDSNNKLRPIYDGGVVTAIYSKSVYPKAKNEYQLNKVRGYVRLEDIKKA